MKLSAFLRDKWIFLLSQGLLILFLEVVFHVLHINLALNLLLCSTFAIITISAVVIEFLTKQRYYKTLYKTLNAMDQKQYIVSLIDEADFSDGKILFDLLKTTTKAMNDEIASYRISEESYREYIETWVHEIKIPISCINLICENNKNELTQGIADELSKIDTFVEQTLFYARSNSVEKDYTIHDIELESLVKSSIKKHSKQLISCKAHISLHDLNYTVYSDIKWLDFIMGQLISNSIKYRKNPFSLVFSASENDTQVLMSVKDNGIGIPEHNLNRVFEKGFTGQNGRQFAASTGIGLYLCKKLCDKMHIGIQLTSKQNEGVTATLIFPKDKSVVFDV